MKIVLRLALAILLAFSLCCSESKIHIFPKRVNIPPIPYELPSRYWCGYFLLDVFIEGQGPYTFLLDTGTSIICVSPSLAKYLSKKSRLQTGTRDFMDKGEMNSGVCHVDSLKCGEWKVDDFDAYITDLEGPADGLGFPIDGIIGTAALSSYALTLDYPKNHVLIQGGGIDPEQSPEDCDYPFEFSTASSGLPLIMARIQGQDFRLVVDTGYDGWFALPAAGVDTLSFQRPPKPTSILGGLHGNHSMKTAQLAEPIQIGCDRIDTPMVSFRDATHGALGTDFLSNFVVRIDFRSKKMTLRRDRSRPLVMPPQKLLGLGLRIRSDAWTVTDIVPNGAAEIAGLRVGNQILWIDSYPVSYLMNCDALKTHCGKDGTYHLIVQRDGGYVKIDLIPELW